MPLTDDEIKKSLEILKAIDEALEKGPWQESLFFQGLGKKLREARENFAKELGLEEILVRQATSLQVTLQESQTTEVYISLYQAEGSNIPKWATILASIGRMSISRPVYKNEIDIATTIRAKAFQVNDAYAAVTVPKDALQKPFDDRPAADRDGRELVMLREGAVQPENITRFVHVSGHYNLVKGTLIKIPGVGEDQNI